MQISTIPPYLAALATLTSAARDGLSSGLHIRDNASGRLIRRGNFMDARRDMLASHPKGWGSNLSKTGPTKPRLRQRALTRRSDPNETDLQKHITHSLSCNSEVDCSQKVKRTLSAWTSQMNGKSRTRDSGKSRGGMRRNSMGTSKAKEVVRSTEF